MCDFACLQAINLTTGDLVFMDGTKFYPVYAESSRQNTTMQQHLQIFLCLLVGDNWYSSQTMSKERLSQKKCQQTHYWKIECYARSYTPEIGYCKCATEKYLIVKNFRNRNLPLNFPYIIYQYQYNSTLFRPTGCPKNV